MILWLAHYAEIFDHLCYNSVNKNERAIVRLVHHAESGTRFTSTAQLSRAVEVLTERWLLPKSLADGLPESAEQLFRTLDRGKRGFVLLEEFADFAIRAVTRGVDEALSAEASRLMGMQREEDERGEAAVAAAWGDMKQVFGEQESGGAPIGDGAGAGASTPAYAVTK